MLCGDCAEHDLHAGGADRAVPRRLPQRCLHAMSGVNTIREVFGVPDSWVPVWLQLVGYPLEEPEAGGQRPRRPLPKSFFEGDCAHPFEADAAVTERLRAARLLQEPGPLPYRDAEVRMLSRMFGLPE